MSYTTPHLAPCLYPLQAPLLLLLHKLAIVPPQSAAGSLTCCTVHTTPHLASCPNPLQALLLRAQHLAGQLLTLQQGGSPTSYQASPSSAIADTTTSSSSGSGKDTLHPLAQVAAQQADSVFLPTPPSWDTPTTSPHQQGFRFGALAPITFGIEPPPPTPSPPHPSSHSSMQRPDQTWMTSQSNPLFQSPLPIARAHPSVVHSHPLPPAAVQQAPLSRSPSFTDSLSPSPCLSRRGSTAGDGTGYWDCTG